MNIYRKIISLLLVFTMLFSQVSYAGIDLNGNGNDASMKSSFPDIKGHWAREAIEIFYSKGWVKGYDKDLFRPDKFISRAEFTAMVVRILKCTNPTAESSFSDVKPEQWFYREVSSAVEKRYILGFPDNTFKPCKEMSRQEVAVFVERLLKVDTIKGNIFVKFNDENSFPNWSANSIRALASYEIIKGYPDGTFKPEKITTRAEAVKMLDVLLKMLKIEEEPQETLPGGPGVTSTPVNTPCNTITHAPTYTAVPSIGQGIVNYPPAVVPMSTPVLLATQMPTATSSNTPTQTATQTPTATSTNTPTSVPTKLAAGDFEKPIVVLEINSSVVKPGTKVSIHVTATDNVVVKSLNAEFNGMPVTLDKGNTGSLTVDKTGIYKVVAKASDASGNEGYAEKELTVMDTSDTQSPEAIIKTPEDEAVIKSPVDINGTANDSQFVKYTLEYSESGKNQFIKFAEGNSTVKDSVLGKLDPTMMRNGRYDVRLSVYDAGNHVATYTVPYYIEGEMKVGNFSMTFNDLTVPVAGLPITVGRTYDSRNKGKGDFGIGWNLGLQDVRISESCIPGEYWNQKSSGSGLNLAYNLYETRRHSVTVTLPDGRNEEFDMKVTPYRKFFAPIQQVTVSYAPREGTTSKLETVDVVNTCMVFNQKDDNYGLYFGIIPEVYNPDKYKLTMSNGTEYIINQNSGVESIKDTNGNMVSFGNNGVIHSAGKSIEYMRDSLGRITKIVDPMKNEINYSYDYYGDLVAVTDQTGNTVRYRYNSTHGLVDIIDPRGVRLARNIYDDIGRIIANIDAEGNRIEYTHDIGSKQETVRDRLGNVTVINYDDNGNVLSKTDPMGNTTSHTYDSRGNILTRTDSLGHKTTYIYDSSNRITSITDPIGNRTEYTYNNFGQVLTKKDALGNVVINTYDYFGNLIEKKDCNGNSTKYTYGRNGDLLTRTSLNGKVTVYTYDDYGNLLSETCSEGKTIKYSYDNNGNRLSMTEFRKTGELAEVFETKYEYDKINRLIKTIYPDGSQTGIEYNENGKKSAEINQDGNRTEFEYDIFGNLVKTRYQDGTFESNTYDAEGNKISISDREGRTSSFVYDKSGRLIKTIYPDGTFIQRIYDSAGNLLKYVDERGNTTEYTYNNADKIISLKDAQGNITSYEYDAVGNRTKMTDAKGNTLTYIYNTKYKVEKVVFEDGTFIAYSYDKSGNKISETNQEGKTTKFNYDMNGNLAKVTDALGNSTEYTYDSNGNVITQIDASGHSTKFEYDSMGRRTKRTLPLGMSEKYGYDKNGKLIFFTSFNGDIINFEYDSNGRTAKKIYPDKSFDSYTYYASGQIKTAEDKRGITYYDYDTRGRLKKQTNPDGTKLEYTYDEAGNRTSVTVPSGTTYYTFDVLNRLKSVKDPDGGITAYSFDEVGNRSSVTSPNGVKTNYTYDSLNRLTYIENINSSGEILSSYSYTLGLAGNRIKVIESTGRTVVYGYDDTYKLIKESITDKDNGDRVINYTYDPVGNRLTKDDNGIITSYTYDANDRLLNDGLNTYTYDNNGNTLSIIGAAGTNTYFYNFNNRLVKAVNESKSGKSTSEYKYDINGARVQKVVDGVEIKYLVDSNRHFEQVLEERDTEGKLIVSYTYGDDLICQKRGNTKSYYQYDGQGSTRFLSDEAGNITDSYIYDVFGCLVARTGTTVNDYLYTGEQYDANLGFYYLRARYMSPIKGRFVTMDTYEGNSFDPLTLHKYLYCNADPINYIDPSGYSIESGDLAQTFTLKGEMEVVAIIGILAIGLTAVYAKGILDNISVWSTTTTWNRYYDFTFDLTMDFADAKTEPLAIPTEGNEPPQLVTLYRHMSGKNPGQFRIDDDGISLFETQNPAARFNLPFTAVYQPPKVSGVVGAIIKPDILVGISTVIYTPLFGGPGHWSLAITGFSADEIKQMLSNYAKEYFP